MSTMPDEHKEEYSEEEKVLREFMTYQALTFHLRLNETLSKPLTDIEAYILKAHFVLEKEISTFLESKTGIKPIEKAKFPFQKKVQLSYMVGAFKFNTPHPESLKKFISLLTDLRNQIAHQFAYDSKTMQEIIALQNSIVSKEDRKSNIESVNMFNNMIGQISLVLHLNALPDEIDIRTHFEEIKKQNMMPGARKYTLQDVENLFRNAPSYGDKDQL